MNLPPAVRHYLTNEAGPECVRIYDVDALDFDRLDVVGRKWLAAGIPVVWRYFYFSYFAENYVGYLVRAARPKDVSRFLAEAKDEPEPRRPLKYQPTLHIHNGLLGIDWDTERRPPLERIGGSWWPGWDVSWKPGIHGSGPVSRTFAFFKSDQRRVTYTATATLPG